MNELVYLSDSGIGRVYVNRPQALNALNGEVVHALDALLDKIAADAQVKVLIVGGEANFGAGADIKDMVECTPSEALAFVFTRTFDKLMNLPIPTIAAIDGFALGGGLELAMACDLRIAAESAKLGMPELSVGIMPGAGGTIRLPRLVGYAKAFEIICLGTQLTGADAERIGLVNKAVPRERLLDEATAWAGKLCHKPDVALRTAKRTMKNGLAIASVEEGGLYENDEWSGLFATEDQKEGMRAFLERRKPAYKGI
jgi:enoyl-CoA hydratase/carnithine racemase